MAELSKEDFLLLHDTLFKRYFSECDEASIPRPATRKQQYGYDEDTSTPSLRSKISDKLKTHGKGPHPNFVVETKNNLYQNYLKLNKQKNATIASIRDAQLDAYLFYLDCKTFDEFKEKHIAVTPAELYDCYYYSYIYNKIITFELSINYNNSPFKTEMVGFHNQEESSVYKGYTEKKNNYLFIDLRSPRDGWEDEFKMIGHLSTFAKPESLECIRCLFLGVASFNYPTAGEVVMLNQRLQKPESKIIVERYLFLKHNRIRLKVDEGGDVLGNLKVRRNFVNEIQHMIGDYRVLNLDSRGALIISKFVINNDYSSYFETNVFSPNENHQVCLLEISNVLNKRLCITCHPGMGTGIISYVMLNIPRAGEVINEGVFCSIGNPKSQIPSAGPIVLLKMKDQNFQPEVLHDPDSVIENSEDEELKKGYSLLLKLFNKAI